MTEALEGLRECIPSIERRLKEATELHELAVQIGDLKEVQRYEKMMIVARQDRDVINRLLLSHV